MRTPPDERVTYPAVRQIKSFSIMCSLSPPPGRSTEASSAIAPTVASLQP